MEAVYGGDEAGTKKWLGIYIMTEKVGIRCVFERGEFVKRTGKRWLPERTGSHFLSNENHELCPNGIKLATKVEVFE